MARHRHRQLVGCTKGLHLRGSCKSRVPEVASGTIGSVSKSSLLVMSAFARNCRLSKR